MGKKRTSKTTSLAYWLMSIYAGKKWYARLNHGWEWLLGPAGLVKTSPSTSSTTPAPGAFAQEGTGENRAQIHSPNSPALSTTSTADGEEEEEDIESSPALPSLPAPKLPSRVAQLLRTPPSEVGEENQFGTASWGSPYPRADHNLRRQSFSSEASDDSLIHHLSIETPFLRQSGDSPTREQPQPTISAAAAVIANRARRQHRGLTEDWIRTHTTGVVNAEPRHWFSEGSDSEHSSLSGSELAWFDDRYPLTPKAVQKPETKSRKSPGHSRGRSSLETLKPQLLSTEKAEKQTSNMPEAELQQTSQEVDLVKDESSPIEPESATPAMEIAREEKIDIEDMLEDVKPPATPIKGKEKPLPEEPALTPRIKKKLPWKGKNITIFVPRDDERGQPGEAPAPLRREEVEKMFSSWKELGYNVDGFDLLVEGYQPPDTDDSQSRQGWPTCDDIARERADKRYRVLLPDFETWENHVAGLQEAKLRALGVSCVEEPPEPSLSPPTTIPSRQASAQYPSLPFSPPIPTSSSSSNHGLASYPFSAQFLPGAPSPGVPPGASPVSFGPGKFNPRQSISLPTGNSPFQLAQSHGWNNHAGILQSLNRTDSPLANLNGILSPQSPYGLDGLQQTNSPLLGLHQRHQSLQYFPQQMGSIASPRLQDVREDDEESLSKSPSKTPEPTVRNGDPLQAEIEDAEYHLEEQLRNQLEHEDYNPRSVETTTPFAPLHSRDASEGLTIAERFASEPGKPMELHHPRPHSRGHSLSQTFFRDHDGNQENTDKKSLNKLGSLREISETQKDDDEEQEIETNPSNLGTPVQNFDLTAAFEQHQKNLSSASNPWLEQQRSGVSSARHSSHGSKQSFSRLNVQAPEFKFNPTSSFVPGMYNFTGGGSFQPAVHQASVDIGDREEPAVALKPELERPQSPRPVTQFGAPRMHASAPSFSPGSGIFSFSSSGPKFRPDAPAFTPFQSLANGIGAGTGRGHTARQDSIFGSIKITANDIIRPAKKSKAIPIVRPSSSSSATSLNNVEESQDGSNRPLADESRVKRAKSSAPDGDDLPIFAERPEEEKEDAGAVAVENIEEEISAAEDGSVEEHALQADTSLSSIITSDQIDTMATTAAPSETSPVEPTTKNFSHVEFEFDPRIESQNLPQTLSFGGKRSEGGERKSLSANAMPFIPGGAPSSAQQPSTFGDDSKAEPTEQETAAPAEPIQAPRVKLTPKPRGLAASRFAKPQSPTVPVAWEPEVIPSIESETSVASLPEPVSRDEPLIDVSDDREMTFEEIDAVMQQMETDPSMGVNKTMESGQWPSQPTETLNPAPADDLHPPVDQLSRDGASLTPRQISAIPESTPLLSTELEDPFVDPPISPQSPEPANEFDELGIATEPASDWEGAFTEDEHDKLENRAHFFDGRVNEVVGTLLATRLEPLEKALGLIHDSLASKSHHNQSTRREVRSVSGEVQESDADDEDEEPVPQRSASPRRDRRMEQMRLAITEALVAHQLNQPAAPAERQASTLGDSITVLNALEDMKEQVLASLKTIPSGKDQDSNARERDLTPGPDENARQKITELQAMMMDLGERLSNEQNKTEREITERRAAEDAAAELNRQLQAAETRVEVEIINRSVFDQRVADLEERLRLQENKTEENCNARRAAEDRLSEVQRLLRISSEEENRLRDLVEERDARVKTLEQQNGKSSMRMTLLEAAQNNSAQSQSEMANKFNAVEGDLRAVRQDNNHWRSEAERADENARRTAGELAHTLDENKHLQKSLNTLAAQLEENERLRESWRSKFLSLQDDMGSAAREVAEENARRIKRDQSMLARQEVLDARLQAEAKTRERLEVEMERLQENERSGMRAVNECKRLEGLLGELRTENHKLQQAASRYQREFEEARESGASEVKRTRMAMQIEVDAANNQVNVIREELEEQNSKLRSDLDNVKLETDTAKAQSEMLLEEAQSSKAAELKDAQSKHQNEIEDMQARYERKVNTAAEDASRNEQQLLERLSLSSSKIEHLQDRVLHLEDKLEIAKQAAAAAAQAAKAVGVEPDTAATVIVQPRQVTKSLDPPEKISPQALRESIMVLQEQLQAREQRVEELEQSLSKTDPEAASKISKRDDEISWLRELLAVRQGDLQDIITALSSDRYDRNSVKDAAIRLKANLQMEEQERERAINGGSAISLPNIAQSIQAATPRVAQTIRPFAAAFDNWRKSSQPSFRTISGALSSPANGNNATPSKSRTSMGSQNNLLSGLLTPPASGLRQTPTSDSGSQPTAFANTGRRFTSQGSSSLGRVRRESNGSRHSEKLSAAPDTPPRHQERAEPPRTPPMMRESGYDSDAQPGDFDDHDFFEED
ncbi:hypothetical protein QQS21_003031 [Conoideocrella luteorostrata]|uniref:Myosin class II heavy chain n=1 Tax=Conoideocrella luteorostrata TaxID=1105319 RepID=A0AAJ0CU75_9HYPO|nr:hypothetical protein QQS21_003031 [Conoideocrella luteorostrata]